MRLPKVPKLRNWFGGVLTTIRRKPSILVAPILLTVLLVVGSVLGVIYGSEALEKNAKTDAWVRTRTHSPTHHPPQPVPAPAKYQMPPTHPLALEHPPVTQQLPRLHSLHPDPIHALCVCESMCACAALPLQNIGTSTTSAFVSGFQVGRCGHGRGAVFCVCGDFVNFKVSWLLRNFTENSWKCVARLGCFSSFWGPPTNIFNIF